MNSECWRERRDSNPRPPCDRAEVLPIPVYATFPNIGPSSGALAGVNMPFSSRKLSAPSRLIAYFRITKARAREILSEVSHSVESWRTARQNIGMSDEELEPFVDAFEHAERSAAKKLI